MNLWPGEEGMLKPRGLGLELSVVLRYALTGVPRLGVALGRMWGDRSHQP
jgi:hypothetical protein